jgi:hypothetical protein
MPGPYIQARTRRNPTTVNLRFSKYYIKCSTKRFQLLGLCAVSLDASLLPLETAQYLHLQNKAVELIVFIMLT